ncbi:MAG: hypothetical protein WC553_00530 [Patescibacteria group bacterium]|jgi:hypothetical protein
MKNDIRPIYSELRGYLSVAPLADGYLFGSEANRFSHQLNVTIDELNEATKSNYDKFKVVLEHDSGSPALMISDYRNRLSGLIYKIQGEYFADEQQSGSGPSTIINANQSQAQSQQQSLIVDLVFFVAEKKAEYQDGTPEKTFLDKFGDALKTAKGVQDIIQLIFTIASQVGLQLEQLKNLFGG